MKAATGELNLTVITIVAVALVIGFFGTVLWPQIQKSINSQWGQVAGGKAKGGEYTEGE